MSVETNPINSEDNLKPLQSGMGVLTRPDGSAVFCQGDTVMMAAVYGPMEAKVQHMLIEKVCVQAHYRPKSGVPCVRDRLHESFIRNTCETVVMGTLYPRTVLSVIVQELQNCGGIISCAINAACLALLDAGVEMKYLVAAVTCMLSDTEEIIVEPGHLDIENAVATFTFVFDSSKGDIIASHTTGTFEKNQYDESMKLCRDASARVFANYKNSVKNKNLIIN